LRICSVAVFSVFVASASAMSCAKRIPERPGGRTDTPHIGWVLMHGDADDPNREFACQSSEPRGQCVLPVDRPEARVLANLHLYYHAAATEMTYAGAVHINFFDRPLEINPNIVVKAGTPPGNQSVTDFVSNTPGTYPMTIAVTAKSATTGQTHDIREQVAVAVR
jgi:hypothetical protein